MDTRRTTKRSSLLLIGCLALVVAFADWSAAGTVKPSPGAASQMTEAQAVAQAKATAASRATQIRAQARLKLRTKRENEVRRLNQGALTRIQGIGRLGPGSKPVPLSGPRLQPLTAQMRAVGRVGPPPDPDGATISMTSPEPVAIGQTLAVAGNNFGGNRGSVTLIAGDSFVLVAPPTWQNDRIEFTVPVTLGPAIGDGRAVRVWVKKAGQTLGPTRDVRVVPDPATVPPHVTGVSPADIQPEVIALIEGTAFGTEAGTVRFLVTSPVNPGATLVFDGVIDAWSDALVAAHLPASMSGVGFDASATIEVRNARGQLANGGARFDVTPALDTEVLSVLPYASFSAECRTNYTSGFDAVRFDLRNGWTVSTSDCETEAIPAGASGCRCTCSQITSSVLSSYGAEPACSGADGDILCVCRVTVTIEGPRGVSWGTRKS